ncbi:MAG: histidinol-phosphatase [Actinomycetota bacterium]|nr:histidinol-phosphatase [Actinomycetota bacterium]
MSIDDLDLALQLADMAEVVTMESFRRHDLVVDSKPDMSLVSEADRGAEQILRDHLRNVRPDDGILGEEHGTVEGTSGVRWVIDPIDGTHNYVRSVPVWATLIAVERDGDIVAGVVSAPALGRRWWAARGHGAFATDGERIHVSNVSRLEDAHLSSGWDEILFEPGYQALSKACWRTRGFGDFWSVVMVAEGAVDIAVEPGYLWDLAPLGIIVEEAGGTFTDRAGVRRLDAGHCVATNGLLHAGALALLGNP